MPFADDFVARKGEDEVDREALLEALSAFLKANKLKADWEGIENAPNEALVNALAMMSPYGPAEKQALLEAPDLKTRAEILVAVTEIELAKSGTRARRRCSKATDAGARMHNPLTVHRSPSVEHAHDHPTVPPAASIRSCSRSWSARSPRARSNTTPRSRS